MPKILFGHPRDNESDSVELRALGLKFNKAEPSRIALIGLRTLEQPGYESYLHHIAGFMYATDTQQRQRLHKVGFPIKLPLSKSIPLLPPPLCFKYKQTEAKEIENILDQHKCEWTKTTQKTGKEINYIYSVPNGTPALGSLRSLNFPRFHPPAGSVSYGGFLTYLTALRIFSSFFRTHLYPAYPTPTEIENYTGLKRRIEDEEAQGPNKRRTGEEAVEEGADQPMHGTDTQPPEDDEQSEKIVLRFAKPSDTTVAPWGNSFGDIPNMHGIVFPFVFPLANWDKDMVPRVMEHHFLRCFGHDDSAISRNFSSFVESWKNEVFNTYPGISLSHMAKVIEIAMPAQARPFPLFEGTQYRGCYLIGANYSVAIKGNLTRPSTWDDNSQDLRSLFGKERLLDWVMTDGLTDDDVASFKELEITSLKQIQAFIVGIHDYSFDPEDMIKARTFAANADFGTRYLPCTIENISRVIKASMNGEILPDIPLHHEAFLSKEPFEVNLSAFGPAVPSPHIPGAKEISDFRNAPTQSTACFRRCKLRSAITEWKDFIEKKVVLNEPRNLNARFQYVKVVGKDEKLNWYKMMDEIVTLSIEVERKVVPGTKGAESMKKGTATAIGLDDLFEF